MSKEYYEQLSQFDNEIDKFNDLYENKYFLEHFLNLNNNTTCLYVVCCSHKIIKFYLYFNKPNFCYLFLFFIIYFTCINHIIYYVNSIVHISTRKEKKHEGRILV